MEAEHFLPYLYDTSNSKYAAGNRTRGDGEGGREMWKSNIKIEFRGVENVSITQFLFSNSEIIRVAFRKRMPFRRLGFLFFAPQTIVFHRRIIRILFFSRRILRSFLAI